MWAFGKPAGQAFVPGFVMQSRYGTSALGMQAPPAQRPIAACSWQLRAARDVAGGIVWAAIGAAHVPPVAASAIAGLAFTKSSPPCMFELNGHMPGEQDEALTTVPLTPAHWPVGPNCRLNVTFAVGQVGGASGGFAHAHVHVLAGAVGFSTQSVGAP